MNRSVFPIPLGKAVVVDDGDAVVSIWYGDIPDDESIASPLAANLKKEFEAYFAGTLRHFQTPTRFRGTPFAIDVMTAMARIPYGETWSYARLAEEAGHHGASRAVGSVCRNNPLVIVYPCHRVIKSSGEIGHYGGEPDHGNKRYLIDWEAHHV